MNIKNLFTALSCLFTLTFLFATHATSAQSKTEVKFLDLIFEIQYSKNGSINAEIINYKIIDGRLKRKTKSRNEMKEDSDLIEVIFRGADGHVVEEVMFPDPFLSDLEYVNEDDKYQHYKMTEDSNVLSVRIPYTQEIVDIQIKSTTDGKENTLLTHSITK